MEIPCHLCHRESGSSERRGGRLGAMQASGEPGAGGGQHRAQVSPSLAFPSWEAGRSLLPALQEEWPGVDMSVDTELLWSGAALLLLLLGAAAGLCVRCSPRAGAKRSEKIYEQRSLQENQQNFAVARTYTLVREAWPGPLVDTASNAASARKDKLLQFSPSLEESSSSRYQNFSKGSRRTSDASYIHPFATDYFDSGRFQKPPEDEDDTNSYENVLICEPKKTESGDEESEGYQNSASIRQWRESRRVVGSPDEDDGEPDYVNGDVAAINA
ncbi:linker for activation of T-cells family member 2 isoform X2 [Globicephala melas]|uniref:linker for activation of T-cells family member 2 isoform X2 n=1 Tax=Globicephala melas TaxID=9731 RepID=UPI00293D94C5|nr:linker for activation of T-cells family member 2 isoform X2 [Globicephala melas]